MSAFLNSLYEEGTERELMFWIGRLSAEKDKLPGPYENLSRKELFKVLVSLYDQPKLVKP